MAKSAAMPGMDQRGYTLVELMVAITITLFIMAGIYGLMLQNQQIFETQAQMVDVQQSARVAIDLMTREIRMTGADPSGRAWAVPTCTSPDYKTPADPAAPAAGDIAQLTVALSDRIRLKLDRPTYALGPEPTDTPTPTPSPSPMNDWSGDGMYSLDDEDGNGDGFIDDDEEDIEYSYDAAKKKLYRRTFKTVPDAACVDPGASPAPATTAYDPVPIAENVKEFSLRYYYEADPPTGACPAAGYSGDYETARDLCDPPATPTLDLSNIRRVRIRMVIETAKQDAAKKKKLALTMASDATIRNRL